MRGGGLVADFGTDGNRWESVLGTDVYLVVSEGTERGDEVGGGGV